MVPVHWVQSARRRSTQKAQKPQKNPALACQRLTLLEGGRIRPSRKEGQRWVRRASLPAFAAALFHPRVRPRRRQRPRRSSSPATPTITPARSPSAISATSGPRTRTAPASRASPTTRAREMYPRFSPDGRWIAFSSNRYGNNDVFVDPGDGRRAEAADVPLRRRRRRRLDARLAAGRCSARRTATARSRTSRRSTRCRSPAGWSSRCPSTGATGAAFRPTASRSCSTGIPPSGRVSTIAAATRPICGSPISAPKTYTKLLPDERYNRYWPMWGADGNIYYVADPLPNDKNVRPGSPEVRKSANNIYKIPASGGQPVQMTKHTDGNLFWPSMSSDGKVIVYEENFGIWKLDVASGQDERDQDRHRDRRQGKRVRGRERRRNEVDAFDLSPSGPARGHLGARSDPDDRHRPRRHHAHRAGSHGVAQPVAEVVARRQVHRVRLRQVRPRRDLDRRSGRQEPEADHEPRQREGRARLDAGLEVAALHRRRQEALQLLRRGREDADGHVERRRPHRLGLRLARQQVGRVLEAGPHAALARLHRADRRRRGAARLGRPPALLREQPRVDGRRPLPRLHVVRRRSATASRRRAALARRRACG